MAKNKPNDVNLLLSKLDKQQLADFIRKECANNRQLQDRFLALGVGTLFKPLPQTYTSRVVNLIAEYGDRYGYIEYRKTYDFNLAVSRILDEAVDAMDNHQWDVAIAVLSGVAAAGDDIINSGDDSYGELGAIVDDCFQMWHRLCKEDSLPENVKSEIFKIALKRFNDGELKGWDWWWDWIKMAIELADTQERQSQIFKALDAIKPDGDDWIAKSNARTAQKFKLELMSRCGTVEQQCEFMYSNVSNPDFRARLIQMAWDKGDYNEVLRLAKDGVNNDAEWVRLVSDWHKWEYKVYRKIDDKDNILQLARYFFFNEKISTEKEFSIESMYSTLKDILPESKWGKYVETLISESQEKGHIRQLLYIYTEEKMWDKYLQYIRERPYTHVIDDAPKECKELFKDEIVKIYTSAVRGFFKRACNRDSYRDGVKLLRNLIKYGGKIEADQIVAEQKSRTPRRPALIDELSKL